MPRCARIKSEDSIFHIIVKSISEIFLFEDDSDKDMYISFMKHYQKIYHFKIYSYCFMSNHAHFIIDANGADISKVMHGINFRFAINFNKKHKRNGHLFQGRFKSKIIYDDRYIITASAYIHRNPLDIKKYKLSPEKYKYSSLPIFLGLKKDPFNLVDENFILQLLGSNLKESRKRYLYLIYSDNKVLEKLIESKTENTYHNSKRFILIRNFNEKEIVDFVSKKLDISIANICMKNNKNSTKARALVVFLLRCLSNLSCKDICKFFGRYNSKQGI